MGKKSSHNHDAGDIESRLDSAEKMEEMMARCRSFVRTQAPTFDERQLQAANFAQQAPDAGSDMETEAPPPPPDFAPVPPQAPPMSEAEKREMNKRKREERERADAELIRAHHDAMAEADRRKDMQTIEAETDDSLMLLERLRAKRQSPTPEEAPQAAPPSFPSANDNQASAVSGNTGFDGRRARPAARQRSRSRSVQGTQARSNSRSYRDRGRGAAQARPRSNSRRRAPPPRSNRRSRSRSGRNRNARSNSRKRAAPARSNSRSKNQGGGGNQGGGANQGQQSEYTKEGALGARVPRRLMYQEGAAAKNQPTSEAQASGGRSKKKSRSGSSSSSSRSSASNGDEAKRKKAEMIRNRMKQWEKEERVQRDFFGWKPPT